VPTDQLISVGAHDLVTEGQQLRPSDLAAAVALRAALRTALTDDTKALAGFPLRPGLDPIIETVATSVAGGGGHRLKLCSSTDCRWAFYDISRNSGGRWCRMEACGDRNKTRAYGRRAD
jgi:predicted RNA-binding Zn ribbon-like protein